MRKINWKGLADGFRKTMRRNTPEILTGMGITGMIMTTVLAVKATPEALRQIEARKREERRQKLTAAQTVQTTWKCYIPAGVTGTVSVACLVGASVTNGRRNAALATAASLAETSLREYRAKVVETIGEKKEETILDATNRERVEKNPPSAAGNDQPLIDAPCGQIPCFDAMLGRWGYSDAQTLRNARDRLNRQMSTMTEPYISLNEFYMEIGWPTVDIGDELGWNVDHGLIDLHITSTLYGGTTPCLAFSHNVPPSYGYDE